MAKLLIYRASAGAGKTYTLVANYIKWALCYPHAFKHILAVTFTNRATQEMRQRIIACLYSLSIGEATVLLTELSQMGWAHAQVQARSKEVLALMVHQYSDFSVTTIDSFFHKIIQSFTRELGLKENFTIEMDESLALKEIVEELVASPGPLVQKWIVDFALAKLLVGKTWNVKSDIQQLGKALFKETFKLYEKELLTALQQQDVLSHFLAAIQALLGSFEQKMQTIGQTVLKILKQEGLEPGDFAHGTKGVMGYFLKLARKKGFEPTKRAIIGRDDLASWCHKKSTNQVTSVTRVIATLLHPLLIEAIDLYEQEGLRYRTAVVVSRSAYSFGIIGALLMGLEQYRSKHNVLFVSDISTLLYHMVQGNDTPFLYEKIGNQFHHFLIDEFQDLSLFQWINIKPLLHNSLAQGYNSLLVGDVKQSIYRWRGSNWKLLNHQVEAEFKESDTYALTVNRRSQETIVLFNSSFFSMASNQLLHYLEAELTSADQHMAPLWYELEQMRRVYGDVPQQALPSSPERKTGYVEFLLLRSDQIDQAGHAVAWKEWAQKEVIRLVAQLQQEEIPAKDMVLLVRNNSEAALLTSLFSAQLKEGYTTCRYTVLSDHARSLWSHEAIKILIHTLYYLNNEDDLINKVAWIQAYCSCMNKRPVVWHHYALDGVVAAATDIDHLVPQSFWVQKDFLKNLSIYACVELLIEIFFEKYYGRDILSFFQSIILDYCYKEARSIQAFLIWWEKRGKDITLPASHNENAIRVMTIHQAKGLEFRVVIMPFCSWHLDHMPQNGPMLWSAYPQQVPFNRFPALPLDYGIDLKATYYGNDYHLERMQIYLDNLNLLYVAFTRAKERLYAMAPLPEKVDNMATTADLIYQSLVAQKTDYANGGSIERKLVADMQKTPIGIRYCFGV